MAKKPSKKAEKVVEEPKEKTIGPFDYINSVTRNKKNMIRGTDNEELAEKGYNAFLTNKALSFHVDTILYANEMNKRAHIDSRMQYEYYLESVRSMSRGFFWPKKEANEDLEIIASYCKVNLERAKEIYRIIGKDGVDDIKKKMVTGGRIK